MSANVPSSSEAAKREESVTVAASSISQTESQDYGKWFFFSNGDEGYASNVVPMRTQPGEGHLNAFVEYVQCLP